MSTLHDLLEQLRAGADPPLAPEDLGPLLAWVSGSFGRDSEARRGQDQHGDLPRPGDDPVLLRMVLFRLDEALFDNGRLDLLAAGLDPDEPESTRRRRFRRLASAFHPDRFPDLADWLTQRSQAVHQAYGRFKQDPEGSAGAAGPAPSGDSRPDYREFRAAARDRPFGVLAKRLRRRFGQDRYLAHKIIGVLAIVALLPVFNLWLAPDRDIGAAAEPVAEPSERQVEREPTPQAVTQTDEVEPTLQADTQTAEVEPPLLTAARRAMNPQSDDDREAAALATVDDQLRAMGLRTDTERLYGQAPARTEAPQEAPASKPEPIAEPFAELIAGVSAEPDTKPDAEPAAAATGSGSDHLIANTIGLALLRGRVAAPTSSDSEPPAEPPAEPEPLPAGKLELGFFAKHPVGLLLAAFHSDLEGGNLPGLVSRFAPDARYGHLRGNRELARHFRELFNQAPERQVNLHVQRLERDGMQWRAEADLEILVRHSGAMEKVRGGRAVLRLGEQNGALAIRHIEYQ